MSSKAPCRCPTQAVFSTVSLLGTYTLPEMGISPHTRQLFYPDSTNGVHVSVGVEGRRDCLLSLGECTLLRLAHSGLGQRQQHLLLSCQGTSLQGLPQSLCEGVRRASVQGILLQAGASLEAELPACVWGNPLNS